MIARWKDYYTAWLLVPRLGVFRGMGGLMTTFVLLSCVLLMSSIIFAFSLSFQQWAEDWQVGVSGQLSVTISPDSEDAGVSYRLKEKAYDLFAPGLADQLDALSAELRGLSAVSSADWLPAQALEELLIPDQGDETGLLWQEMGMPLYIELSLHDGAPVPEAEIRTIIAAYNPQAALDDHGRWSADILASAHNISIILLGFDGLMVLVLVLCCYLLTQSDLMKSRQTVEVLGLLGSPTRVIVMIMVRRILRVVLRSMAMSLILFLLFWLGLSFAFQIEMAYLRLSWQVGLGLMLQYGILLILSTATVVLSCRNYLLRV